MKNAFKTALFLLALYPILIFGEGKLIIDLKVPVLETANLVPAQVGASIYLMQSDWARVSDVGEDVAVWIRDYDRHVNLIGQQVISCVLEIREPSMLRIGNLKQSQKITVRYWQGKEAPQHFKQEFLNDLDKLSEELKVEAFYMGKEIEATLKQMLL